MTGWADVREREGCLLVAGVITAVLERCKADLDELLHRRRCGRHGLLATAGDRSRPIPLALQRCVISMTVPS